MIDHDRIGCFADQMKLTCALVRDLHEAIKEIKLLGEHEEEASRKITELEALCKKLREETQKMREEKAKLEEMVESHNELIMEFVDKFGYNCSDEDADDEDDDDGGDVAAPPAVAPEVIIVNEEDPVEMVPKKEAPEVHDVILIDVEPEPP
jgi:hypothetical protein